MTHRRLGLLDTPYFNLNTPVYGARPLVMVIVIVVFAPQQGQLIGGGGPVIVTLNTSLKSSCPSQAEASHSCL